MSKSENPQLSNYAKELRKNMTKEEKHLWYDFLKKLPVGVHRQKVIGDYIVDFYCAKEKLVIEIDGVQHYQGKMIENDEVRDNYFINKGITVLRYTNPQINKNFKGVCEDIFNHMSSVKEVL